MDPRELQALLAFSAIPFLGERSLRGLLEHARESRQSLAQLWQTPVEDLRPWARLHPKAVAALDDEPAQRWARAGDEARAILERGVDVLLPSAPDCPPALRELGERWTHVFAFGALRLVDEPRVAFANSSSVTPAGLNVTDALADALARRDVVLVASTNREAYQAAATAAKRHAGPAILVLDRGMYEACAAGLEREPVATARVWDSAFDPELQLLLSPFGWRERWTARSGPRRDALIFDLATAIVAVDVKAGGVIDRECRRALEAGKPVLALDRGAETPDGTRRLWEETSARRLPWRGAEDAAGAVTELLPSARLQAAEQRHEQGWQRELAQFLARAASLQRGRRDGGAMAAVHASGPFAEVARSWSPAADRASGAAVLLADLLYAEVAGPVRVSQLLERCAPGGVLAAVIPVEWLNEAKHRAARERWLSGAALRLAARLPLPAGGAPAPGAAVLLERSAQGDGGALVFQPDQERMGRFHLRRYLQEVLTALDKRLRS